MTSASVLEQARWGIGRWVVRKDPLDPKPLAVRSAICSYASSCATDSRSQMTPRYGPNLIAKAPRNPVKFAVDALVAKRPVV